MSPAEKVEKLAAYYLKCLSHEREGEISLYPPTPSFPSSQYLQVSKHPAISGAFDEVWGSEAAKKFLSHLRKDPARHLLYVGYPVFVRNVRGAIKIEPLFLFQLKLPDRNSPYPELVDESPRANQTAFEGYGEVHGGTLFDELLHLQNELGLTCESGVVPDLEDWIAKLQTLRPEWPWPETLSPKTLDQQAIESLDPSRIHNCAILCSSVEPNFTKGLETELSRITELAKQPEFKDSALYALLNPESVLKREATGDDALEVLRLNKEQRLAVEKALSGKVTVITGPPGTGKSQVLTAILANAAFRGWKTLIASKNNKAVDVVEARANGLAASPFLLRLGGQTGAKDLAQQITHILSSRISQSPTSVDLQKDEYRDLQRERKRHEEALLKTIELRNKVDSLDREIAVIQRQYDEKFLTSLKAAPLSRLSESRVKLETAYARTDKNQAPSLARFVWRFVEPRRIRQLESANIDLLSAIKELGLSQALPADHSPKSLVDAVKEFETQAEKLQEYERKLQELQNSKSLEAHYDSLSQVGDLVALKGVDVWRSFLSTRYSNLQQSDRKLLGEYASLLNLMKEANAESSNISQDLRRQFTELTKSISHIFTASGITSLSLQGRVPFQPASLDLVLIDEASQCDIASAIPLLIRAKRVVVIGDPLQLSHITQVAARLDASLLKDAGLESLRTWGYSQNSLFMMTAANCRSDDVVTLVEHHRSVHDIISFSNSFFYQNKLRVATRSSKQAKDTSPAVVWHDVKGKVTKSFGKGAVNDEEARAVASLIEDLLVKRKYTGSVGVVTPFRGQANRIRDYLSKIEGLDIAGSGLLVDTVHKFQGDERDMMIFSPTVSTGISPSALGFLNAQGNLFNVAITRARSKLVTVGDISACANSGVSYLSAFVEHVSEVSRSHEASRSMSRATPSESAEYPAVSNPEMVSEWERRFYRALYKAGIRTIPQYAVDEYRLDFAIIDGDRRLNIEVDGEQFHRNWDGELIDRDQLRNRRLTEQGWQVLRFWVYQIRDHEQDCVDEVRKWLGERQ